MTVILETSIQRFVGASTDTKPSSVRVGSTFYEYDTGILYKTYDGTNWAVYSGGSLVGAALASGKIIQGNASNVGTAYSVSGDISLSGGVASIASGVIIDADIKSDAAIALTKLASLPARMATFVVAASDAPAIWKAQADYVCDGTNDDLDLLAAYTAAASGDVIQLSPGTFNWNPASTASLVIANKTNLTFAGQGRATKIKLTGASTGNLIQINSTAAGCAWRDLLFDGDSQEAEVVIRFTTSADYAVARNLWFESFRLAASGSPLVFNAIAHPTIENIYVKDCYPSVVADTDCFALGIADSTDVFLRNIRSDNAGSITIDGCTRVMGGDIDLNIHSASASFLHGGLYIWSSGATPTSKVNLNNLIFRRSDANKGHGSIEIRYATDVNLTNIYGTGFSALEIFTDDYGAPSNIQINNYIGDTNEYGVHIYNASTAGAGTSPSNIRFGGNLQLTNNTVAGISVDGVSGSHVTGLKFKGTLELSGNTKDLNIGDYADVSAFLEGVMRGLDAKEMHISTANLDSATTGTGAATFGPTRSRVITGTTASSTARIYKLLSAMVMSAGQSSSVIDWAKPLLWKFNLYRVNSDAEAVWYVQIKPASTEGALAGKGIGLAGADLAVSGISYGSSGDSVSLGSLTSDQVQPVVIWWNGVDELHWFINGVWVGSQTTAAKLPSTTSDAYLVLSIINGATGTVDAQLGVANQVIMQGV